MNHAGEATLDGFPVDVLTGVMESGQVAMPARRSLAIVGSHPATRELAPYEDQNFDIWLFNEAPQKPEVYRRWDASFQMHLREVYSSAENWVNKDHWAWLQQDHGDKVIWMQEVDERVPNSYRYPIEEVLRLVPYRYLRSTPAMALALAILIGYEHIQIYGSELTSNTEYGYQAINFAFWIGFAHGMGVNLEMKCWQSEFNQPIYGYDGELEITKDFYGLRMDDLKTAARLNKEALERVKGRMRDAMLKHDYQKVADLSLNLEDLARTAGEAAGAWSEAERYAARTSPISRQEYERVSAQAQIDAQKANDEMHHLAGVCEYVWNTWKSTGRMEALQQLRHFIDKRTEAALECGRLTGVMRENLQYISEYDTRVTAAGGQRAVLQATRLA